MEYLQSFVVLLTLRRAGLKAPVVQPVPVSFLEPDAREIGEEEVVELAMESLRSGWRAESMGPLRQWQTVDWVLVESAKEWVVASDPAKVSRTSYVPDTSRRKYTPSEN
ncbi:hypothetical protein C1280_13200 [Gemmata obscuriglobus]|uniref:Uncharacterized protein n=1 Tax=Gemmata obscuriglobus TaxID=114 RepID=A0A2Z3GWX6_9BACT|nr:hypothetical protein C1280_13200 [Gemmata obscuriglobus]